MSTKTLPDDDTTAAPASTTVSTDVDTTNILSATSDVTVPSASPSLLPAVRPSASPSRITRHDSRSSPLVQQRPRSRGDGGSSSGRPIPISVTAALAADATADAEADSKTTLIEDHGSSKSNSSSSRRDDDKFSDAKAGHQIAECKDKDDEYKDDFKDGDVGASVTLIGESGEGEGEGEDKDFFLLDALAADAKYEMEEKEALLLRNKSAGRHTQQEEKEKEKDRTAAAAAANTPGLSAGKKSKNPVLFLAWDGEPDSVEHVEKLKRFLKAKGYVIFEHAGGDCSGSQARIAGFDATTLQTSNSVDSLDGSPFPSPSPFPLGGGGGSILMESSASVLKPGEGGSASASASARAKVSQALVDQMTISTVFVSCVTRAFTKNMNSKKMVLRMRELQIELGPKRAAEMLYVMIHGTFTTESYPYHCRSGWLGYFLRDSLWSPAWNHAHVAGAAEAIASTVNLRRNVVRLNPLHVLYIETRGQKGACPPSQIG